MRIALIPAYEPEPALLELLRQVREAGFSAVVVDDGSGEKYNALFQDAGAFAEVLGYMKNCGKGCALKTGMRYIRAHFSGDDTVVTLDSDGQHSVADALRVCEESRRHPDALVLGSRALRENVPLRSRLGNGITRFVYRAVTGVRVHDTQTGLRAFPVSMIPELLEIPGERYEYEMNELLTFARGGRPIREVEISTIYFDQNRGSHFDTARDSLRVYREILKFSASSLVCFLLDYGLYALFSSLTSGLGASGVTVSNLCARVVSAGVNYTLNRRLVFRSKAAVWSSALKYFALAAVILAGNTLVLNLLVLRLGWNRYLSKLLTELLFFTLSWSVQHAAVFPQKNSAKGGD